MSGGDMTIIIFAGMFLAVLCIVVALSGGMSRDKRRRVEQIRERAMLEAAQAGDDHAKNVLRGGDDGGNNLERLLAGLLPRREALRLRLLRAGLAISVGRYAAICLGTALFFVAADRFALGLSWTLAVLFGVSKGIMVPHIIVKFLISRRINSFNQLFPEAIDLMVRGLKSGLPISETIVNVGEEMPDPVGVEFRAISDAVRLGATLDEALWEAARRLDLPEFRFFTISLSVQRETGGNLGETLGNLGDILRKRLAMRLKVKAMSSEARASAYIIGSLPFIMFMILYLMNGDYVMRLFTDPRGILMTAVGLAMMALGAGVMYKMVKFEV